MICVYPGCSIAAVVAAVVVVADAAAVTAVVAAYPTFTRPRTCDLQTLRGVHSSADMRKRDFFECGVNMAAYAGTKSNVRINRPANGEKCRQMWSAREKTVCDFALRSIASLASRVRLFLLPIQSKYLTANAAFPRSRKLRVYIHFIAFSSLTSPSFRKRTWLRSVRLGDFADF